MNAPNGRSKSVIDFDQELPQWSFFRPQWLAKSWHCSTDHVLNLVEMGELLGGVDLRGKNASRTMIRISRKSLVQFLNHRKNLEAVAAANPRPKYREESRRRQKHTSGKSIAQ